MKARAHGFRGHFVRTALYNISVTLRSTKYEIMDLSLSADRNVHQREFSESKAPTDDECSINATSIGNTSVHAMFNT